jgi:dephospho-CoA kinase
MQIVAITGAIGCGKTTLADLVRQLGYVVYDVDKWCRHLYFEDSFLKKIEEVFPQTFENGVFNKRKLRQIVFDDRRELRKLETLTHPFLKQKFFQTIHRHAKRDDIIFIDIALLFEMNLQQYCTFVILADTDYETQKKRVMARDHISEADFVNIVRFQMKNSHKKALSDAVIETNKSQGMLKIELIELIGELLNGKRDCI